MMIFILFCYDITQIKPNDDLNVLKTEKKILNLKNY